MRRRLGIDASILVRLLVAEPEDEFRQCVAKLRGLVENKDVEILASNQVIGEAYIAVQHHYGVDKQDAKEALSEVLRSGIVAPLSGRPVLEALAMDRGPGLFDHLIASGYADAGMDVLTQDRKMASLPGVSLLLSSTA